MTDPSISHIGSGWQALRVGYLLGSVLETINPVDYQYRKSFRPLPERVQEFEIKQSEKKDLTTKYTKQRVEGLLRK